MKKAKTTPQEFVNSVTGISTITAISLVALRRFDLAAIVFGALALGSAGVAWDRYSTKSGAPLDIRVFQKKRLLDEDEVEFIATHTPYVFLAVVSFFASQKFNKPLIK